MSKIKKIFTNTGSTSAYALMSAILALVPEELFTNGIFQCDWPLMIIVIVNRIWVGIVIFVLANIIYYFYEKYRKSVSISGKNVSISIEYGDLFAVQNGKIVINFDECFTTKVGDDPADIKPTSVCGQYLEAYPISDMQELIVNANIKPAKGKSEYMNQIRYKPGTIVPRDRFFIMAFAKLDKKGRGYLSYKEYLECLNTLWEQIDLYHGTDDVYIPILGSNITYFDRQLTQQELLDIMVGSYILSPKRMKIPYKLHIVCRRREGFTLDEVKGID